VTRDLYAMLVVVREQRAADNSPALECWDLWNPSWLVRENGPLHLNKLSAFSVVRFTAYVAVVSGSQHSKCWAIVSRPLSRTESKARES
jgi:hypothetical protein